MRATEYPPTNAMCRPYSHKNSAGESHPSFTPNLTTVNQLYYNLPASLKSLVSAVVKHSDRAMLRLFTDFFTGAKSKIVLSTSCFVYLRYAQDPSLHHLLA